MKRTTTSLLALISALGIATAGGITYAQQAENDAVTAVGKAQITLTQAVVAAEQHHKGAKAAKAELEHKRGEVVYEVEVVAANNEVFDVKVDAVSGKVVSSHLDKHDQEDDDE